MKFIMKKNHLVLSIIAVSIVILWSFLYYKILFNNNMLISLDDLSSTNVLNIALQHILVNLVVIVFFAIGVKRIGSKKLFLHIPSKKIWKILLAVFVIAYCALFAYALNISHNIIKALYTFIFYLVFVSFTEEYLYRGLVPALQKNELPKVMEWILPNVLFSLSHYVMLFVEPSGMSGIAITDLLIFFISTAIFGIIMEFLKRNSNSLYIGVLAHAIYDFYGEIMLWL